MNAPHEDTVREATAAAESARPMPPAPAAPAWRQERAAFDPRRKSPVVACLLSLVPGLGQIYVGFYGLGFLNAFVVGTLFTMLVFEVVTELMPLLVIFFIFFMLYNIVDAGRRAALYNQALEGMPGVELPKELLGLPRFRGSVFGGVGLVVAGLILLMHTAFGMSLVWIEQWWPVGPILFGCWLVWRALQERQVAD